MRLQGALDNEVLIATKRFIENGIAPDVDSLYLALQRSNSSLKRRPKKTIQASLERVLEHLGVDTTNDYDSEQELDSAATHDPNPAAEAMNKSLRANLAPPPNKSDPEDFAESSANLNGNELARKRRMANGEPLPKRPKAERPKPTISTNLSLNDVGGLDHIQAQMKKLIVHPLLDSQAYRDMRIPIPKGILLHGPPGCGKTMLSKAFAAEMDVAFVEILGPAIVSGMSGESEKGVREKFEEAKRNAPCLLFIDEIDAIAPKRESSQSQMDKRIVAQLLVSMDDLDQNDDKPVIVLATTNRPDSIDPALRRGGRFGTEISIGVPNEQVRESILRAQLRDTPTSSDVDFKQLAKMTAGFVGADLHDLVSKAGSWEMDKYIAALEEQAKEVDVDMELDSHKPLPRTVLSIRRLVQRLKKEDMPKPQGFEALSLSMAGFLAVLPGITPSSKREGFATIPDVSWQDIGALQAVRKELQITIVEPITNPHRYAALGLTAPTGVLLWGPPGCGKTLIAKAAAAESKANFISIKGPELLNKYVGESEAAVRRVFTRARSSVPCVIFIDELDALIPRRDESNSESSARVVNTFLAELDGTSEREGIFVIGATNRPEMIDDAMLRPGRLEIPLFVDLPGPEERAQILQTLLRGKPVQQEREAILDLVRDEKCPSYSGADLSALYRQAAQNALQREGSLLETRDFEFAISKVKGSVFSMQRYYKLRERFGRSG